MKNIIKKIPIPTAGVALGLASLGVLLQPYSEVLHSGAGILSLFMILMLTTKMIMFPQMIKEDFKSPIFAGVFGTFFMTLMILSTYLAPFSFEAACVLWCAATLAHLVLIVWFTKKFLFTFDLKQVFPSYFIAFVGISTAALTSAAFGFELLGMIIFWFGFACYAALFVLISYRYLKHEVPEPAKPLFCIYAAPMSLSLASYLTVAAEPSMLMVLAMTVLAQVFFVIVLAQLPKLLRLKFYPSYAAMTFPFVISANALAKSTAYLASLGANDVLLTIMGGLVLVETLFASVMVIYVFACYMRFFFWPEKSTQTEPALP